MDIGYSMPYETQGLCPFIIFLVLKKMIYSQIIPVLSLFLLLKITPLHCQTKVCYVFYNLHRHFNLLLLIL